MLLLIINYSTFTYDMFMCAICFQHDPLIHINTHTSSTTDTTVAVSDIFSTFSVVRSINWHETCCGPDPIPVYDFMFLKPCKQHVAIQQTIPHLIAFQERSGERYWVDGISSVLWLPLLHLLRVGACLLHEWSALWEHLQKLLCHLVVGHDQ